jgi:hypothetical protein
MLINLFPVRIGFLSPLALVSILTFSPGAHALVANASANWVYSDTDPVRASGNAGAGNFTVGPDVATAGANTNTQPVPPGPTSFPYAANSGAGFVGFTATVSSGGTTSTATSQISVGAAANGFFPWQMMLDANVTRSSISSSSGTATAPGSDPQFFNPAGFGPNPSFSEMLSLGSGSSVFEQTPGTDVASISQERDTSLSLNNAASGLNSHQLFSIGVTDNSSGTPNAVVRFSSDPNVMFTDPTTHAPITSSSVQNLLNFSSLGSLGGLPSDLPLFDYAVNLGAFSIGSTDFLSAQGVSVATSAPEPASLALLSVGLLGLAAGAHWRRD